jgi:pimeloyl-ACP methyl ester carboxylesterase
MTTRTKRSFFFKVAASAITLVLAVLLALALLPINGHYSAPFNPPPPDYQATRAALDKLFASVPPTLSPEGHPRAFLHDQPTDHVFVFLHGLTSAPEQFDALGRQLFERGHNVVIVLSPGHGESNLMTDKLGSLTAQGMLDAANNALNLSHGLGRDVTLVGLSINGATAAWFAQNRPDVNHVVLLSPFFAPLGLPQWAVSPLSHLVVRLPNTFLWWDPRKKEAFGGPPYTYPRFPTHSIGRMMLLGEDVFRAAKEAPSASQSILVVTTASDIAVNNTLTARLVENWRSFRPEAISAYQFPRDERVPHDFIDPHQSNQLISLVYPRLIEMLETGKTLQK